MQQLRRPRWWIGAFVESVETLMFPMDGFSPEEAIARKRCSNNNTLVGAARDTFVHLRSIFAKTRNLQAVVTSARDDAHPTVFGFGAGTL